MYPCLPHPPGPPLLLAGLRTNPSPPLGAYHCINYHKYHHNSYCLHQWINWQMQQLSKLGRQTDKDTLCKWGECSVLAVPLQACSACKVVLKHGRLHTLSTYIYLQKLISHIHCHFSNNFIRVLQGWGVFDTPPPPIHSNPLQFRVKLAWVALIHIVVIWSECCGPSVWMSENLKKKGTACLADL